MKILAIETSCDETAISILEAEGDFNDIKNPVKFKILANNLISQIDIHKPYGGVFPALAKREHSKNLIPILRKTLTDAKLGNPITKSKIKVPDIHKNTLKKQQVQIKVILEREPELLKLFLDYIPTIKIPEIDAIAVTQGPGLEPALWVGINFAKALSLVWNKPLIPVNHLEGHLFSAFASGKEFSISNFQFPIIGLLISGGHTELILIKDWLQYEKIGQTKDDAVGEAFDKVARMLNLPYPGGPEISKLAEIERQKPLSAPSAKWGKIEIKLPRPMLRTDDFDFSFSGLKTAVLYLVKNLKKEMECESLDRLTTRRCGFALAYKEGLATKHPQNQNKKTDLPITIKQKIALEFENAVVEILLKKTQKAVAKYNVKTVILGGGVIANRHIRHAFQSLGNTIPKDFWELKVLMPEPKFATDNAVMIGIAGYFRFLTCPPAEQERKGGRLPEAIAHLQADGNLDF